MKNLGHIEGLIPMFAGIYAFLLAKGVLPRKPRNPEMMARWRGKYGRLVTVLSPLLVIFGVIQLQGITSSSDAFEPSWKRYTTSDGICSAEFPRAPLQDTKSSPGVESSRLTFSLPSPDIYYMLTFSDIPQDAPPATDDERLDAIRDGMPALGAQAGTEYKFIQEARISENGARGRDLEFATGEKYTFRAKVFILGRRIYRIIVVAPRSNREDELTTRFLSSFQFEKGKH